MMWKVRIKATVYYEHAYAYYIVISIVIRTCCILYKLLIRIHLLTYIYRIINIHN